MKKKVAIIDIGSNTTRLVIYKLYAGGNGFKELENIKVSTRLRTYLDDKGVLQEEGTTQLIDTLITFSSLLRYFQVEDVTCVATATIRQAKNKEHVLTLVKEKTGLDVTILNEYEEGYCGYLAVIQSTDITDGITVDMGGGSTEITCIKNRELIHYASLPFGSLSLKLQYVAGDVPTSEERKKISDYVQKQLDTLPWVKDKKIPIIAIGGSARNIIQIHQTMIDYPIAGIHQYEMEVSEIKKVKEKIVPLSVAELQDLEGLSKDRVDTILPAIEALDAICERVKAPRFIYSRKGLREGVLYQKINKNETKSSSIVDASIAELIEDFNINKNNSEQVYKIAQLLFTEIQSNLMLKPLCEKDLKLLKQGSAIFNLGKYINEESSSHHTFYILINRTILGLSHQDRVRLALIASYKRRGSFKQYVKLFESWFDKAEISRLSLLGAVLKIAECLNATKRNIVEDVRIEQKEKHLLLIVHCKDDYKPEQIQLEKQKKHLEKVIKQSIVTRYICV
ncbi:Ppx/GppA phosphatase family protein [Niallia sp. 01092]|uniref:Ppx/GppA phosphatase family protein n=1 Tax=unclassified Niallia TaxID=2837522 RepID=UPI003FCFBCDA